MTNHKQITIIVDTREQEPYFFTSPYITTIKKALPAGDYSIENFETQIAVERKSLDDFVQTIIHNRWRFYAELKKLRDYPLAWIVVEGSIRDVITHQYICGASPESILGFANQIEIDYGIPVHFCGDRPSARMRTEGLLRRAAMTGPRITALNELEIKKSKDET